MYIDCSAWIVDYALAFGFPHIFVGCSSAGSGEWKCDFLNFKSNSCLDQLEEVRTYI